MSLKPRETSLLGVWGQAKLLVRYPTEQEAIDVLMQELQNK